MTSEHGHAAKTTPAILKPLRALDGVLRRGELVVLVTVLISMIGVSFAQVVMRKVRPFVPSVQEVGWFDILARHLVLWVGILGASIAAREGRHFGVELLPKLFSERGRQRLEAVLNLAAGGVTLLLTAGMIDYVRKPDENALFVIDALSLPVRRWWLLAIMPAGLALMSYRFFLRALEASLLDVHQWHALERELKPDVTAPAPSSDPASQGSGAVIEAATPPAVQEAQEHESERVAATEGVSDDAHGPLHAAVRPPTTRPIEKSTDEIKIRRLGDLGDVIDPPPGPANNQPVDPDVALVDSDMTVAGPQLDEPDSNAATERQQPQPPPADEPKKGGAK